MSPRRHPTIVAFDLDDTLYDESTYVRSGFRAVADHLATVYGSDPDRAYAQMLDELCQRGRGRIFDALLDAEGLYTEERVAKCIAVYRQHEPQIEPAPGALEVLERHRQLLPLYLVTDGDPQVQARKITALGIADYFEEIFLTWSYGPEFAKPSLRCFQMICAREGRPLTSLVYVGDDPAKDFVNLRCAGATTVRVMTGRHAHVRPRERSDAEHRISTVAMFDVCELT